MKAALVIMAAGMGSRYGGSKQVDGIGPGGEILMEYSIYDAIRAGFDKVVFIIKDDIVELVDRLCGNYLRRAKTRDGQPLEVCYAMQSYDSVPDFYEIPAQRTKPFGTVHAVLCARDHINEPFCVINADDYYGPDAFRVMYDQLQQMPADGHGAMVGYLLKNTVSENGTVTRGICQVEDGRLIHVREVGRVRLAEDGCIVNVTDEEHPEQLDPESPVSMNFWGFAPSVFGLLQREFERFVR